MVTSPRLPKLTPKGRRTRLRIVSAAADLIYAHGATGTTIEDVKAAAEVSGSQLYHYFTDKEALVQAVIDHQSDTLVTNQQTRHLDTVEGLRAWRDFIVDHATLKQGMGGCPLGSLAGQLAESDPDARAGIAAGFGRWSAAIRDGLKDLHSNHQLRADIDPDALAATLLATLQGGLLLAQVHRDTRPLEMALDTMIRLVTIE
jgi:TetR/AcrR family transcriptional repressor of nem operon